MDILFTFFQQYGFLTFFWHFVFVSYFYITNRCLAFTVTVKLHELKFIWNVIGKCLSLNLQCLVYRKHYSVPYQLYVEFIDLPYFVYGETEFKNLRSLEICGGVLTDAGVKNIKELSSLVCLNLSQNSNLTDKTLELISGTSADLCFSVLFFFWEARGLILFALFYLLLTKLKT